MSDRNVYVLIKNCCTIQFNNSGLKSPHRANHGDELLSPAKSSKGQGGEIIQRLRKISL